MNSKATNFAIFLLVLWTIEYLLGWLPFSAFSLILPYKVYEFLSNFWSKTFVSMPFLALGALVFAIIGRVRSGTRAAKTVVWASIGALFTTIVCAALLFGAIVFFAAYFF